MSRSLGVKKKFSTPTVSTLIVRSMATDQSLKVWTQETLKQLEGSKAQQGHYPPVHQQGRGECMCILQVIISQKCTEFERASDT